MASIGYKPIEKLRRDVSPYFQAATELPDLPEGIKEIDNPGYRKYDADIREWWANMQENLGRMQDQVLTFAIADLDSKHVGLSTSQSSALQAESGVINQSISNEASTTATNLATAEATAATNLATAEATAATNLATEEAERKANIVAVLNNQYSARTGTAAEWTSDNPTLADAEIGLETDTGKVKMGDGAAAWNSLPYFS